MSLRASSRAAGSQRAKAQRHDLQIALDEILDQHAVTVPTTPVDGCLLDRARPSDSQTELTYEKEIAPMLAKHCQSCHQPRRAGPFSLLTYDDTVRWSAMIREVVMQRRMPSLPTMPWQDDGW